MKYTFLFFLMFLVSCSTKKAPQSNSGEVITDTTSAKTAVADSAGTNTEIIETFVDSLNIGVKGECKIELIKHRVFEDLYVIVNFYTKGPAYWYHQNTYLYECNAAMSLDPAITDFNNDKLNDLTFISATAGRGANEVRRLFIYDDQEQKLISIVNSEDYPNMLYNKELDCIDAFLVYGGNSTVFARIEGDSLKEFASVNNDDYFTVYEVDRYGKRRLLLKDTITKREHLFTRYINYKPLKAYTF